MGRQKDYMCQEEEPRSIEKENKRKRIVDKKKRHREERRQPKVMKGPAPATSGETETERETLEEKRHRKGKTQ